MMNERKPLPASEFKQLIGKYAGREFSRKSILSIRDGAGVIDQLLGGGQYKRVLEIGTYRGVSSAYMAQFCERVITVDLINGKMEQDHQLFDRVRFWEALEIANIDLRLVCCDLSKAAVIAAEQFDFAFVDGDHEGDAPRRDFELVKRCGTVLFHDYDGDNGVMALIDSLPKEQIEIMDIFALWRAPPPPKTKPAKS